MTRMDALRKVLFGGLRSPDRSDGDGSGLADGDTATGTVDRTRLPAERCPFLHQVLRRRRHDQADAFRDGKVDLAGHADHGSSESDRNLDRQQAEAGARQQPCRISHDEWVQLTAANGSYVRGMVTTGATTAATDRGRQHRQPINMYVARARRRPSAVGAQLAACPTSARAGLTICNTTDGATQRHPGLSETNTNLPRMKVARGNFSLWNAGERWQCRWRRQRQQRQRSAEVRADGLSGPSEREPARPGRGRARARATGNGRLLRADAGLRGLPCSAPNAASSTLPATTNRSACCRTSASPTGSASA